jgi:Tfp pilus assembly major pilin PilA
MDRNANGGDTRIDNWLLEQQHIDASSSFLLIAGSSQKLPMRLYHIYIELLQFLADISAVEIDVWNMPTARQLALASESSVGFTVNFGNPYVSIAMSFENNPAEVLFGSGAGTVAVVGIVAAIAIPAYQDYTVRAHVTEGYNLAARAQESVAAYHATNAEFPPPSVAATIGANISGQYTESVRVIPGSGIVIVSFFDSAVPDGGQLYFEPYAESPGIIEWICSGTIADKQMPEDCRYNDVPEEVLGGA